MNNVRAYAGVGMTATPRPFVFYIESMVPDSVPTLATVDGGRVVVAPRGTTLSQSERTVYNAIITQENFTVAGNGKHASSLNVSYASAARAQFPGQPDPDTARGIFRSSLDRWTTTDRSINPYDTPRIAVLMDPNLQYGKRAPVSLIGTVGHGKVYVEEVVPLNGMAAYISTGMNGGGVKSRPVKETLVEGLVGEMYGIVDQDSVLCSAIALWDPLANRWDLAVKNR